jgi:hypothetical protein
MTRLLILCLKVMFFINITVVGLRYFGLIGLAPLGWWVWSRQLERRHG